MPESVIELESVRTPRLRFVEDREALLINNLGVLILVALKSMAMVLNFGSSGHTSYTRLHVAADDATNKLTRRQCDRAILHLSIAEH